METQILKASDKSIALAAELLKNGEVVAVPTETVYGLAGDCRKSDVVKKIFIAKGRPQDNPLIVHISNMNMLNGIVSSVPDDAKILAENFWPGPLTIIMPKGNVVCNETCAGLDSVGVRMPKNEVARKIIEISGVPFAAPSANLSGKPSPTNAQDVFVDMNGRIPLIIDDGKSNAGVESTVVSVLEDTPIILRPGVVTKEMMESVLHKEVKIANEVLEGVKDDSKVRSPGMKYKHYAPNADITIVKGDIKKFIEYVENHKNKDTFVLCFDGEEDLFSVNAITYGNQNKPESQAQNLFSCLRELDVLGAKTVFARCPETTGVSLAVYNRLIRMSQEAYFPLQPHLRLQE